MINLIETDVGRPIDHISNNLSNENLPELIRNVLRDEKVIGKRNCVEKRYHQFNAHFALPAAGWANRWRGDYLF